MAMLVDELTDIQPPKSGGQKETRLAQHPKLGAVAYKKILNIDPNNLDRTKREIRAAGIIGSDHVPKIYGHNCDEIGATSLWIIEEFVDGETIRERLNRGIKFSPKEVLLFLETMLALAIRCEEVQLVHRDIKPENVIIDKNGKFWLLDFGIARHLDLHSLTESAQRFGLFTLGYASTEQFRNLKKDIDIRADLFSIGIVASEMLTGENFYRKNTNDPLVVLNRMEKLSIDPIVIPGDTQFQLSAFICMIADYRRTRRPGTASEAKSIFDSIKSTLQI